MRWPKPDTSSVMLVLAIFLVCPSLFAQQYFNGPYQLGGYDGVGAFRFYLNKDDTVFNGPFLFHQSNINSLLSKEGDKYFRITGTFKDGLATDEWSLQFGDYLSNGSTEVSESQYVIRVNGVRHTARGKLAAGKASGRWLHRVESLNNSEVNQLNFESDIEYSNGIPQKSFRIRNQQFTLLGRFLRDGLAHDEWDLYADELRGLRERWVFTDGRLVEMIIANDQSYDTVRVFDDQLKEDLTVNLDERYIKLIDVIQRINRKTSFDSKMNRLLEENNQYYKRIDEVLTGLGNGSFMPDFKVKVQYAPLTDVEKRQLKDLEGLLRQIEKIGNSVQENTQLQMLKITEEGVSFQLALIKALSGEFILPESQLLEFEQDSILHFLGRDSLLWDLSDSAESLYSTQITYDESGSRKSQVYSLESLVDIQPYGVEAFLVHAQQVYNTVDSVNNILEDNLLRQVRIKELEGLDKKLVSLSDSLMLFSDTLNQLGGAYSSSGKRIRAEMTDNLRRYSRMENLTDKIDTVNYLISCTKGMISMVDRLRGLPDKQAEIKELYTDRVWNPFVATLMDEEVKKRITSAYNRVLVPYFLEQIALDSSCENIERFTSLYDNTHQRMRELREEETSKLERRLRRQTKPVEIMMLFGIQSPETN